MRKFSRDKIIDFVYESWYNKNIITKEMIKKFENRGLSNKID